jgi:hypothetical protein
MASENLKRISCVARKEIRTHEGVIKPFTEGIILAEIDNLGRRLLRVQWENGMVSYVFPSEVEIVKSETPVSGE